jgi:hypothetical protein
MYDVPIVCVYIIICTWIMCTCTHVYVHIEYVHILTDATEKDFYCDRRKQKYFFLTDVTKKKKHTIPQSLRLIFLRLRLSLSLSLSRASCSWTIRSCCSAMHLFRVLALGFRV